MFLEQLHETFEDTVFPWGWKSGDERISLYVNEDIKDEEDIRNLLIKTMDGKQLRIGDIARVERGYSEPQRNGFFVNGKPALAICMAVEQDAIVPDVGKAVDARLAEVTRDIPVGFHTEKIFFQPDKVDDAISSFMWNWFSTTFIAEYQPHEKITVQLSVKEKWEWKNCFEGMKSLEKTWVWAVIFN